MTDIREKIRSGMIAEPQRSLEMLKRPSMWPNWPLLLMKKPGKVFEKGGMAVVIEEDGGKLVIAKDANMWAIMAGEKMKEKVEEMTAEKIIEEGWRVD